MLRASRTARLMGGLTVAGLLVAACGDDAEPVATDAPENTPVATATEPEPTDSVDATAAPESTIDPAVTAAPDTTGPTEETTAAPAPETTAAAPGPGRSDLTLRSNGVGAADFGQADVEVIPYVTGGPWYTGQRPARRVPDV